MQLLKRIRVAGWKSILDQTLELTPLTVVIGANGSGKSNLLSLFRLLNVLFARSPGFRSYVGKSGYADSLLHFGTRRSPVAELELAFEGEAGENRYFARWVSAARGTLIFAEERVEFRRPDESAPLTVQLGEGHSESNLMQVAEDGDETARSMLRLLRSCRLFHFHDTSEASGIRNPGLIEANRYLFPDASNLAPMLFLYRERHPAAYRRIRAVVRQMVADFDDFILEPSRLNERQVLLKWTQRGREYEFGPHQLSDGSLRLIALAALLLQPEEDLPRLIAFDEPELGLHPAALQLLAGMVRATSENCQVVLATQSANFLDHFEPEEVVVVNTVEGASQFQRLGSEALHAWLGDYTLGEIWQKNVVGGGPYT